MATRAPLKGVYRLNPTKSIMKLRSLESNLALTEDVKGFKKVKPPKATKGKRK